MLKTNEIRDLSTEQLNSEIEKLKEELFNLRFQLAVGQLENTAKIRNVKKTIARIKTIIHERNLEASNA